MSTPLRYRSYEEDSGRWTRFPFREGDVVVSTRSKSGTTWMQQICLSLVHGAPVLPAPLGEISPWLDWLTESEDELFARLQAQPHRRVVKTHTPLDGVVLDPRATYVVVARDPLDAAVSMYHQGGNLDRERHAELSGRPVHVPPPRPDVAAWLAQWTRDEVEIGTDAMHLDTVQGIAHHARDAWSRRGDGNVVVVGYADLIADREGHMRRLADRLGLTIDERLWPELVAAAGFESMQADAARLAPDLRGVLKDPHAFFRRGRPGEGRGLLGAADLAAYERRMRGLVGEPGVLRLLGVHG